MWNLYQTWNRQLSPLWRTVDRIVRRSDAMQSWTDAQLDDMAQDVRWKCRSGDPLTKHAEEVFALVREVSRRELRKAHYPVQIYAGLVMIRGTIAEMQTGEGKTLTAALPATIFALVGKGCHVVTANEYLAERDAEILAPVYRRLGLTVGCIKNELDDDTRRVIYGMDITYGTASEMGFDFLRDRLRRDGRASMLPEPEFLRQTDPNTRPVQREHFFALIDEADHILIDDGRTPLIIGLAEPPDESQSAVIKWCHTVAGKLQPHTEFLFDAKRKHAELTEHGLESLLMQSRPRVASRFSSEKLYTRIETALRAIHGYSRDKDYMISEDEVQIVDESTGRVLDGRKWQDGLHQAVEAKEKVPLTEETRIAARITLQGYFRRYTHRAGMTGTAWQAKREFRKHYGLAVRVVPTNKPCLRVGLPTRIFVRQVAKYRAIAESVREMVQRNQAVLIGTPSVAASELLSEALVDLKVKHRILNARQDAEEAEIVKQAGQPASVTVATNMAGRGTDIELHEDVKLAGGLRVIATERHSSLRIDRQLIGRCARQGDPGSYQFFLSLEDELFHQQLPKTLERWKRSANPDEHGEISSRKWLPLFRRIQRRVEQQSRKERAQLLKHEQQRTKQYLQMGLDPCLDLAEDR